MVENMVYIRAWFEFDLAGSLMEDCYEIDTNIMFSPFDVYVENLLFDEGMNYGQDLEDERGSDVMTEEMYGTLATGYEIITRNEFLAFKHKWDK